MNINELGFGISQNCQLTSLGSVGVYLFRLLLVSSTPVSSTVSSTVLSTQVHQLN